ncbi:MAG TPA: septal ring lytic transglycosylase RlpA family protein [Solirubrobacterales bacterium]|nr:septal ring lytic transglycosylase RlpA family protein [Solirubrobacterales bacterium]
MTTIKQTSLRWAVLLAALLALMAGAATGAKASTGGAASTTASAPGGDLAFSPFRYAGASWYGGPSMWGRSTACGKTLRPSTLGVAHKSLPCGTTVKFVYHGRVLVTQVIDRGPYVDGRAWDFTQAASEALGFEGVGRVRYAVALSYARLR